MPAGPRSLRARPWEAGRRYAESTKRDTLITVSGLTDFVMAERKRVPGQVVQDAQRLESIVFSGYDSFFEGDEPPAL